MRAKYFVEATYNNGQNIVLHPIGGTNARTIFDPERKVAVVVDPAIDPPKENQEFFGAYPGGEIKLLVVSAANAPEFTAGREFYVDFTPAD